VTFALWARFVKCSAEKSVELITARSDVSFAGASLKGKSEDSALVWGESVAFRLFRCCSTLGALGKKSANLLLVDRDIFRHYTSHLPNIVGEIAPASMIA
jgi:hypothetical protein